MSEVAVRHFEGNIDLVIIDTVTDALDALVAACLNVDGSIVAPSNKELIAARKMLPSRCANSLVKKKETPC